MERLIATKLYVPRLRRDPVPRPRLTRLLARSGEARLTLVSAPAGFGKTTLLTAWLAETTDPAASVAWLSLDRADDDPTVFWTYVVTALRQAVPGVGTGALELLASSPVPTQPLLTLLLNELAASPMEVWLVLDDYHLVQDPRVCAGVAFVLEHLPAQVHVVLSTRSDPDLPLARWRARGELVEVRAADLRFTPDEARTYLDAVPGVRLDAAQVATLEDRTEGWIAALQLAALSLEGREDVPGFVAGFAGDDRFVLDYLVDEVLQQQPAAVRLFLLQTAVLDRLTGALCDALTGREDGVDLLLELERRNLFLVPLDDRRIWYRYHHLFADVLRARLLDEHPDQAPALHRRASRWYESRGLTEEAVGHALAARDFVGAGRLMELAVPGLRRDRQDGLMHGWLQLLPDDVVRRSPVLSVFHGSMLMTQGHLEAAEARLDDATGALADVRPGQAPGWAETDELRTLPATIAVYRAALAQAHGDPAATEVHARHALELAFPDDHLARGGAAGFLGIAAWARGDVPVAASALTQAVVSLGAAGNLVDELSSTVALGDLWRVAGRPSRARRSYADALRRTQVPGLPASVVAVAAELHVALGHLGVEVDDLDAARQHLDAAGALHGRAVGDEGRHRWCVARALLARAEGDLDGAVDLLDRAEHLRRPGFFPDLRPVPALRARVRVAQGRLPEAVAWARDRGVTSAEEVSYPREFDHLTLVRLLLAQHRVRPSADADGALPLLARLGEAAEAGGRGGSLLEIRMLRALAHAARGEHPSARTQLGEGFAAAPEGDAHVRLFLDEGAPLLALLRDALEHGVAVDHVRTLLAHSAPSSARAPDVRGRPVPDLPPALSARELQVLRLLDSDLTGPEIARELFVSPNTLRSHTKHLYTKLDVTSRRSAVQRGRALGLV